MEIDLRNDSSTEVDRVEAEFINRLIDKGVILPEQIGKADLIVMGELIGRYGNEMALLGKKDEVGIVHETPKYVEDKIKTLLGYREIQDPEKIKESLEISRKIVSELREKTGLPITGAIVCGSRINSEKMPREDSDLDMYLYINSHDRIWNRAIQEGWEKIISEMKLPIRVSINGDFNRDSMTEELSQVEYRNHVSDWGWNPKAFEFVGSMFLAYKELKDGEATSYLRGKMSTKVMDQIRKRQVLMAENIMVDIMAGKKVV